MTTNTTPSTASQAPAVSIDTPEFRRLAEGLRSIQKMEDYWIMDALIAHIDAKLAQARGFSPDWSRIEAMQESLREHMAIAKAAIDHATAAEAKLEAIRQGADGLKRYFPGCFEAEDLPKEGQFESPMWGYINGEWLKRDDVLALLRPQPQADESGLPG